ncbi:MAG: sigma-70 family RNA polymerase sigma factor [Desulforhopalus sp.]|jgi:RNA polymerase sigma-70 factor (ECF subfamily)|nr:sigma-70 family RNA polymerase sigma factor [Desulforhopalus sp.]
MVTNNSKLDPDTWVDNYADSLFSYAFFRVQNRSLAEELVQETFVAALVAKDKFKGNSSEKTWFFAILKNKIIDQLRRKYREKLQSLETTAEHVNDDFFNERGEWLEKPGKWREMPPQNFEQREFMAILRQCLTGLSANQCDAFTLREFDDVGSEEICKVLGISPTNYWVLLHRARLVIRKCLERNWFGNSVAGDTGYENVDV